MEDLKSKNLVELFNDLDNILYVLSTHNKNYTKEQYNNILNLIDYIDEIKERVI